jgi:PAS domain S-box-containing protein
VTDLRSYFHEHPEFVKELPSLVKVLDVNKATINLYKAKDKAELLSRLDEILGEEDPLIFVNQVLGFINLDTPFTWTGFNTTLNGDKIYIQLSISTLPGYEESLARVLISVNDITELKTAENALAASEEKFRSIFEQAYEGICLSDEAGIIIEWNQVLATLTGIPEKDAIGTPIWEIQRLLSPQEVATDLQIEEIKKIILNSLQDGTRIPSPGNSEFKIKTLRGEIKYISQMIFPVKTQTGYRLATLIRDLTDKKQAEEELHKSNERYQSIAEDMPVMISRFKHDGTLTYVNRFYSQYYNAKPGELIGKNLFEMVPETERKFVKEKYLSLTVERPFTTYEFKAFDMEGNERWQKWTDRALFDQSGAIVEFQSIGEDITERKQAEEFLVKSEARFRSLIANAGDMIMVIDAAGSITFASPSFERSLGYASEDMLGQNFMKWIHPDDISEVQVAFESRSKTPGTAPQSITVRGKHKDGSWRYLDGLGTNLLDDPTVKGIVLNIRDVTENEKAESALRQMEEKFSKAFHFSPIGISISRFKDSAIIDVNDSVLKIFGYSRPEMLGRKATDLNLYADNTERQILVNTLIHQKMVINQEVKGRKKSGEIITLLLSMETIKIGDEDCIITSIMDITERKIIEDALKVSETNLNHAQAISHTGSWHRDIPNDILTWSDETYRIFGVEKGTPLSYEMFLKLSHPDDRELLTSKWEEALKNKTTTTYATEYRIIANNEIKWVNEETEVQFDPSGLPTAVFGIVQDVTRQRRIEQERQALTEIMQNLAFSKGLNEFLGLVHQSISHVIQAKNFFVTLYNEATGLFENAYFADQFDEPIPSSKRENSLTSYIFHTQEPLIITEEKRTELTALHQVRQLGTKAQSWIGIPLKANEKIIGVMVIQDYEIPNLYTEKDLSFLTSISGQVASAVEKKRAESENAHQLSELETLYESSLAINSLYSTKEIAQKVIGILERKMKWHHIAIRQYNATSNTVELIGFYNSGLTAEQNEEHVKTMNQIMQRPDQGLSGWVTMHGMPLRVPQVKRDARYQEVYPEIQSGLYAPLKIGERVIGSISVESEEENGFTEQDERLLVTLAAQAAVSIENATLYLTAQNEINERKLVEDTLQKRTRELVLLNNELEHRVKERTAEIEFTRQRLELATKSAGLGIWEWNINDGTVIWDNQMHNILGSTPYTFDNTMKGFINFIHTEDLQNFTGLLQEIIEGKNYFELSYRIIRPDGGIRFVHSHGLGLLDDNGKVERMIGTADDVTLQKQSEQAVRESEAYARLLFDASPDPISVAEADGIMVDVNKFFEEQHGVKRDEIRGKHISELNIFPMEEVTKAGEYIGEILQGKKLPPVELNFYTTENTLHTLEMHSYPIQVYGRSLVLSTSRDITEHKLSADILRRVNNEMERALRIKDEFLASMSHELRTPLNAILGISESLEEQIIGPLNEKQLKYLRTVSESGHHLLELINDILDLSKIEAGRIELNPVQISADALVQSSLRIIKEMAQKKDLRLNVSVDPKVKTIQGDERRLKQVLVNLLSNAVKFTQQGGEVGLELKGDLEKSEVSIAISDNGIGIKQEDIGRLFKPFVQLDSSLSREYTGTGLGLALVAQMVRLHGGSVSLSSEVGKGSRFMITIPWDADNQSALAARTSLTTPTAPLINKNHGEKVMVFEDTEAIAQLMNDYISYLGYKTVIAHNGLEGLEIARREKPDLIFMDIMMPGMNGIEATREIRKDEKLKTIPIIALTALAMPGDREKCIEAGMNDYLSKPIKMNDIAEMISKHLLDH